MAISNWFQGKLGNVVFILDIYSCALLTFGCSVSEKEGEYHRLNFPGSSLSDSLQDIYSGGLCGAMVLEEDRRKSQALMQAPSGCSETKMARPLFSCIDQSLSMGWPGNRCDLEQGNSWQLN